MEGAALNVIDVMSAVKDVGAMTGDPEAAHGAEDDLHQAVLLAIATGDCDDAEGIAREALKTQKLTFPRWCA